MPYKYNNNASGAYHMTKDPSTFEPQRNNNFEVVITFNEKIKSKGILVSKAGQTTENIKIDDAVKYIRLATATFGAPQANLDVLKVHYQNNLAKYAGKPEFSESSITFNDFIGADIERILDAWFNLAYNLEKETIGSADEYKQTATLYEYSPNGDTVRSWVLEGVWLSSFNLGEFDQEGGSVRRVTGTLQYDRFYRGDKGTSK